MMIKKSEWGSVLSRSLPCAVACYFIHSSQVFFLHLLLPSIVGQSLQTEILQLLVNNISASQFLISSLLLFIQLICSVFRIFVHLKFFPNQAQNNICFISCKDINRSQNPCASPQRIHSYVHSKPEGMPNVFQILVLRISQAVSSLLRCFPSHRGKICNKGTESTIIISNPGKYCRGRDWLA